MITHPLYVNILWHMHQPFYKDLASGRYIMPWVGLHATKDYLDMPLLVGEYEGMRATFNMVPSLLNQIDEYAAGAAIDNFNELARKRPEDLNPDERARLVKQFFSAHHDRMIKPHARYLELCELKGWPAGEAEMKQSAERFSEADLRDLQTWFYLAWIDPMLVDADPRLQALIAKQRHFSEEDKQSLFEIVKELCGRIVPEMKRLWNAGNIEVSTTPFYHPILPLLVDTQNARRARPDMALPHMRFQQPEDARRQIQMGLEYFEKTFGRRPAGMWPSEGSVCPELIPMFQEAGINWAATDEGVLARSTGESFWRERSGRVNNMDALYRPWRAELGEAHVHIFFRDRFLSDQIGFKYANWPPADAAADMIRRLEEVHYFLKTHPEPHCVSIILDGENCWEHYERDGEPFLRAFYSALVAHRELKPVTPSEYLDIATNHRTLKTLHSGSWINEDFGIWIGHEEDNASWDLLSQARADLVQFLDTPEGAAVGEEAREQAWRSIYIAEGSDWNWWYGDDHNSGIDDQFDELYRRHLSNVYSSVGLAPPSRLLLPIASAGGDPGLEIKPTGWIRPTIDGRVTGFYEWFAAGRFNAAQGGDSMHQAVRRFRQLYFGFGDESLFLRADFTEEFLKSSPEHAFGLTIYLFGAKNWRVNCMLKSKSRSATAYVNREADRDNWQAQKPVERVAFDKVFEIELPFELFELESRPGDMMRVQAAIEIEGREMERCPSRAPLSFALPEKEFEERMWNV